MTRISESDLRKMKGVDWSRLDPAALDGPSRLLPALGELLAPDGPKTPGRRPRNRVVNDLGQNKGEQRFDAHLADLKAAGRIKDYRFEPFNLRLPGRVWFRIDFAVRRNDGSMALVDHKSTWVESDALVKLKTASETAAWLGPVFVARYVTKQWLLFPVSGGRVSAVPDLDWLKGRD